MCKHVAATLYGVGARLDRAPELFFLLRQVDGGDLIAAAGAATQLAQAKTTSANALGDADLSAVFGIEIDAAPPVPAAAPATGSRARRGRRSGATR